MTKNSLNPRPVVRVTWVDSSSAGGAVWKTFERIEGDSLCVCTSVGFIAHEDKESITIASHHSTTGHWAGDMKIPKVAVRSRKVLKR